MKHLVIAEKPSVGRDIARVLHCNKKTNTYIEGTDYIVTWALGHLVTLADPEQYDEQYKTWNMDTLPKTEEHTSELQSLSRISYAVFCLKKKKN